MKKIITNLFTSILLISIIGSSCGSSNDNTKQSSDATKTSIAEVFDVPLLIGKNIDDVRKILGKPTDKEQEPTKKQMKINFDIWDNSFKKNNRTLLVTFNTQNRKVIDFFIDTTDSSGASSDYSDLLQICNVSNENDKYSIVPVPSLKDNTKFTGIKIVAK